MAFFRCLSFTLLAALPFLSGCGPVTIGGVVAYLVVDDDDGGGGLPPSGPTQPPPLVLGVDRNFGPTSGGVTVNLRVRDLPGDFEVRVGGVRVQATAPEHGELVAVPIPDHRFILDPEDGSRTAIRDEVDRRGRVAIVLTDTSTGADANEVDFFYLPPTVRAVDPSTIDTVGRKEPIVDVEPCGSFGNATRVTLLAEFAEFDDPVNRLGASLGGGTIAPNQISIQRIGSDAVTASEICVATTTEIFAELVVSDTDGILSQREAEDVFQLFVENGNGAANAMPLYVGAPYAVEALRATVAGGRVTLSWRNNMDGPPLILGPDTDPDDLMPDMPAAGTFDERFPPDPGAGGEGYDSFEIVRERLGSTDDPHSFAVSEGDLESFTDPEVLLPGLYRYTVAGVAESGLGSEPVSTVVSILNPDQEYDLVWDRTGVEAGALPEGQRVFDLLNENGRRPLLLNQVDGIAGAVDPDLVERIASIWILTGEISDANLSTERYSGLPRLFSQEDVEWLMEFQGAVWLSSGNLWSEAFDPTTSIQSNRVDSTQALLAHLFGLEPGTVATELTGLRATNGPSAAGDSQVRAEGRETGESTCAETELEGLFLASRGLRDNLASFLNPEGTGCTLLAVQSRTEICDNGEDDDGDGNIDAADPECETPPQEEVIGLLADRGGLRALSSAFTIDSFTPPQQIGTPAEEELNRTVVTAVMELLGLEPLVEPGEPPQIAALDRNIAATSGGVEVKARVIHLPDQPQVTVDSDPAEVTAVDMKAGVVTFTTPDRRFTYDPGGARQAVRPKEELAGRVAIKVIDSQSGRESAAVDFYYLPPSVEQIDPPLVDRHGMPDPSFGGAQGTVVTIRGRHFEFTDEISLNGIELPAGAGTIDPMKVSLARDDDGVAAALQPMAFDVTDANEMTVLVADTEDILTEGTRNSTFSLVLESPNGVPLVTPIFTGVPYPVEGLRATVETAGNVTLAWRSNVDGPPLLGTKSMELTQIIVDQPPDGEFDARFPLDMIRTESYWDYRVVRESLETGQVSEFIEVRGCKESTQDTAVLPPGLYRYSVMGRLANLSGGPQVETPPASVIVPVLDPGETYILVWDRAPTPPAGEPVSRKVAQALAGAGKVPLVLDERDGLADVFTTAELDQIESIWILSGEPADSSIRTQGAASEPALLTAADADVLQSFAGTIWMSGANVWSAALRPLSSADPARVAATQAALGHVLGVGDAGAVDAAGLVGSSGDLDRVVAGDGTGCLIDNLGRTFSTFAPRDNLAPFVGDTNQAVLLVEKAQTVEPAQIVAGVLTTSQSFTGLSTAFAPDSFGDAMISTVAAEVLCWLGL